MTLPPVPATIVAPCTTDPSHAHVACSTRDAPTWHLAFPAHVGARCAVDPLVCEDRWLTEAYAWNTPCPACTADPGEPCTAGPGDGWSGPMPAPHAARVNLPRQGECTIRWVDGTHVCVVEGPHDEHRDRNGISWRRSPTVWPS